MPSAFVPLEVLLAVGGTLLCFAGYRLSRTALAIIGFVVGFTLAGTYIVVHNTVGAFFVWLIGGLVGAIAFTFAYFIAIGLLGAGLGVVVTHAGASITGASDPP